MKPAEPSSVKLFVGVLYRDADSLEKTVRKLVKLFGEIDWTGEAFEFVASDYYAPEMGAPLFRRFLAFEKPINPGELAKIKLATNAIENDLIVQGKRLINLDPGYMDYNKVVLASAKYNAQKIYLSHGIYADPTLWYKKGEFKPYPSAFPDFQSGQFQETFMQIRALYKKQRLEEGE